MLVLYCGLAVSLHCWYFDAAFAAASASAFGAALLLLLLLLLMQLSAFAAWPHDRMIASPGLLLGPSVAERISPGQFTHYTVLCLDPEQQERTDDFEIHSGICVLPLT